MTRTLLLTIAAVLAVTWEAHAIQLPPGSVTGIVHDSTRGVPLADAAVFLWDTPHRTTTDADGRFRLDSVPPGVYDALFFHPRLGRLGLSPGPARVRVDPGSPTELALGTPTMKTVLGSLCALEGGPGRAAAVGRVIDASSGVALPGAEVVVSWRAEGAEVAESRVAESDDEGWYRACGLPATTRLGVSATFLGRSSLRHEVALEAGEVRSLALGVRTLPPVHVRGRLVDALTGVGIGDAEVWLAGTPHRRVSAPDGAFAFGDVRPGAYTLAVRHLAYGSRRDSVALTGGSTVEMQVELDERAVPLAPITVTVERGELRDRAVGGTLITRTDIDQVRARARDVVDALRALRVSGLVMRRGPAGLCIGFTQGQARMSFRRDCVPALVYIDDTRAADPEVASTLPLETIDRIILLRPLEAGNLYGMGSGAGVVLIYTKGG